MARDRRSRAARRLAAALFHYRFPPYQGRLLVYADRVVLRYWIGEEANALQRWTLEHPAEGLADSLQLGAAALRCGPGRLVRYGWKLSAGGQTPEAS
ncbi:hypothetical protein [Candidatus Methylocalor cossyra]|uniref:Uncharacterized protein n=1 Tax=Candidatus Methylocalor cossyra TaxID=3108543 RepID=A0ABM9NL51_9GAMM